MTKSTYSNEYDEYEIRGTLKCRIGKSGLRFRIWKMQDVEERLKE